MSFLRYPPLTVSLLLLLTARVPEASCVPVRITAVPAYKAVAYSKLDQLEKQRFGHTNRDIPVGERVTVLEWSLMGGKQPGTESERLSAIEQRLASMPAPGTPYLPTSGPRKYIAYAPGHPCFPCLHKKRQASTVQRTRIIAHRKPGSRAAGAYVTLHKQKIHAEVAFVQPSSPDRVTQLLRHGNSAYLAGDYNKSVKELSEAIKLNPDYAPAYVSRGFAYRKLGNAEQMKSDFQIAKRLDSKLRLPM